MKYRFLKLPFIFLFPILFFYCNEESPLEVNSDQIVVQAFLYANEPVYDIKITKMLPLGDTTNLPEPINDAEVQLIKNGQRYTLKTSMGDSGYYHYEGNDLLIQTGDLFTITVSHLGKTVTAQTIVPPPPDSVKLSPDTIYISNEILKDSSRVRVSWAKSASNLFFITFENIEINPEPIQTKDIFDKFRGRFISQPTNLNYYNITNLRLTLYGKHLIQVYSINQEYADLYLSRKQDSRDLNEPLTNIKNGLGIFSAFNSKEVYFYALKK